MEDNKNPTCPFNGHKPCVTSCMFVIGYSNCEDDTFNWLGCKLMPKELDVSLDPDYALMHIAEMLEIIANKMAVSK